MKKLLFVVVIFLVGCGSKAKTMEVPQQQLQPQPAPVVQECCESNLSHHHFDKQKVLKKLHETKKQIDEAIEVMKSKASPGQPW